MASAKNDSLSSSMHTTYIAWKILPQKCFDILMLVSFNDSFVTEQPSQYIDNSTNR